MAEMKIFNAPQTFPRRRVYRLIEWYRGLNVILRRFIQTLLFLGNWVLRIATVGLWYLLVERVFKQAAHRLDLEKASELFMEKYKAALPPSTDLIQIKSDTQTFNHVNDYVIKDNIIWFRRRIGPFPEGENIGVWEKLYFDGELGERRPVSISSDGANLFVVDDKGFVHYRKVLLEGRGYEELRKEEDDNESIKYYLQDEDLDPEDKDTYVAVDVSKQQLWQQCWYNFPVLSPIVNAVYRDVRIQGQTIITHRGRYNDGYRDAEGQIHPTSIGCTTAYELSKETGEIFKHDPWAPVWSNVRFYFPENEAQTFVATRIESGGSCLFAIGYDVNKKNGAGKLTLLFNFCDIDMLGGNPLLTYAYETDFDERRNQEIRVLPDIVENEGWHSVALPENAALFDQITVIQGRYSSRLLRIAGRNGAGETGYFEKEIADDNWCFIPSVLSCNQDSLPFSKQFDPDAVKHNGAPKDYSAILFSKFTEARVEHFGTRAYHAKVLVTLDSKTYTLGLHRRWGIKTFLGMDNTRNYELVVPKESSKDPNLLRFFKGKRVMPVKVTEQEGKLSIMLR